MPRNKANHKKRGSFNPALAMPDGKITPHESASLSAQVIAALDGAFSPSIMAQAGAAIATKAMNGDVEAYAIMRDYHGVKSRRGHDEGGAPSQPHTVNYNTTTKINRADNVHIITPPFTGILLKAAKMLRQSPRHLNDLADTLRTAPSKILPLVEGGFARRSAAGIVNLTKAGVAALELTPKPATRKKTAPEAS